MAANPMNPVATSMAMDLTPMVVGATRFGFAIHRGAGCCKIGLFVSIPGRLAQR